MRSFRAALCALAISAVAAPVIADPIKAPGAPVSADPLIPLVDQAIAITRQRNLDFQVHTPWQILHGLLALRNNYTLKNGDEFVNAIDFITAGAKFKGEGWFERTPAGAKAHPYNGTPYDFEGHVNQTLAIIAMCDLPLTHQFTLNDGTKATMAEMVRHAQWSVTTKEETTWTLWFLTHYLDQDTQWTNFEGEQWSMERLVRIQTASSPYNAPCGGCHSLFALAYARNAYLQKHGKLQGAWLEADQKLQQYINASQAMMNRDGSFATQFFKARGFSNDFNERIKSSGHMIEWLMVALPRKRLDEQWVRSGVQTLANDLIRNAAQPADCGPLYHSLHALVLFRQRMEPTSTPTAQPEIAQKSSAPAGALTLSTPDGESMPTQPQKLEASSNPGNIKVKPAATATAEPKTVTPGTPVDQNGAPKEETKTPVQVAEEPRPVSANMESGKALKPAALAQTPALVTPPALIAPSLKPAQVAEQQDVLKKLSAGVDEAEKKAEQAAGVQIEELSDAQIARMSPVAGGMPILKKPDPALEVEEAKPAAEKKEEAAGKPAAPETSAKTEGEPKAITPPADAKQVEAKVKDAAAAAQEVARKAK
ncbi:hypothetical protein SH661x_002128 [Planctomicrobium sp. SH661]|uniref:hypothetical protein n=1 Tax=Planctomicrobium sp. SH661 TaxID=3448124 RepID=UPI003F5BD05E